jgi:hypothetical protein
MKPLSDYKNQLEIPLLVTLILGFILLNIPLSKFQIVFADEPGYTDPAVSAVLGQGFSSGAWYAQNDEAFFAGNVPLHELLLIPWLKLFGFGLLQVRSINWLYVALGCALIWDLLRQTGWIKRPLNRLGIVTLLLFGETSYLLCHLGRPDGITFLLATAGLWLLSLSNRQLRLALFVLIGALSSWAGLQLVAYWIILSLIGLGFYRFKYFHEMIALGSGTLLGLAGLYLLYQHFGVWDDFLKSILPHTTSSSRSKYAFTGFYGDRSFLLLGLASCLIFSSELPRSSYPCRLTAWLGLTTISMIPLGLLLLGKFPAHYTWMPLLATLLIAGKVLETLNYKKWPIKLSLVFILVALLAGYPRRVLVAALNWKDQTNAATQEFVGKYLKQNDHVLYSSQAYYAVKDKSERTYYFNWYPRVMSEEEKEALTFLALDPEHFKEISQNLPGSWEKIDSLHFFARRLPNSDISCTLSIYTKK